ncbi:MAG TPA: hypothetical protein DD671_04965 [Balneolaceae bacterium]|nr:hypothetical protein [Balneola sp.]HBQ58977.1 hypothetical protein [Balneolaceae bacterium]
MAAYSLFYSNYKNGDYEFALKYGKWMMCAKPEKLEGNPQFKLDTQYNRLVTIYTEVGRSKESDEARTAYIDTALTLINEQLELFGNTPEEKFDIIFKRGRFYQTNYNYIEDGLQKAYQDYEKLFEMNPERAVSMGDGYYLRQALNNLVSKGEKERAQALIDNAKPHAEGEALSFIEEQQQELLGSPEEQVEYFAPIVEENPADIDAWRALAEAYDDLGERAKLKEARLKINELDPSFESAMALAELAQSNANYAEADRYFKESIERAEEEAVKRDIYLDLADANISMGRLTQAKRYVQNAINIDPNHGNSYIKMATVYGAAVTQCTEDRKLQAEDKVVYWLVIDYLNKAKSIDSSVSNTVNSQLNQYEEVTPNTEDKFFTLGLEDGQSIKIDSSLMSCYGFINESTTVR